MTKGVEVLNITETRDGAVFLLDDLGLIPEQAGELLTALFVLAFEQLTEDLQTAEGLIKISLDPEHENAICVVRGILVEGRFQLLTYFGGLANPQTTLRDGLLHIAELIATVREEILED